MTTPDQAGIVITLPQMYAELRAMGETLGRVEGTVSVTAADVRGIRASQDDHETRVRSLEASRWPLASLGALSGVAGAVAGAWALLTK